MSVYHTYYRRLLIPLLALFLFFASAPVRANKFEQEMARSQALNQQALERYRAGDLKGAIGIWRQAEPLARSRETGLTANAEVLNNLGFAYYKLGVKNSDPQAFETASSYLSLTLQVAPERWVAYLNLADTYLAMHRPDEALYGYRELLRRKPDYPRVKKIRSIIRNLQEQQDKRWKTYHGKGFSIRYPAGYRLGGLNEGGVEISPPKTVQHCQPHCPRFLLIYTASAERRTLEDWILQRWRMDGLEAFHLFSMTPQQSHYGIDCLQSVKLRDGLQAYKLHRWIQAVGDRHYYVKHGSLVVDFNSIATGLGCEDQVPEDWIRNQIMASIRFEQKHPGGRGPEK